MLPKQIIHTHFVSAIWLHEWCSFKTFCPLDFFQTEPYISYPLLSAINSNENTLMRSNNKRSYDVNRVTSTVHGFEPAINYDTDDFTIEKPNVTSEFNNKIRLASLGMVVKSIFKDIVIRPINGFAKLVQTAKGVWESQIQWHRIHSECFKINIKYINAFALMCEIKVCTHCVWRIVK